MDQRKELYLQFEKVLAPSDLKCEIRERIKRLGYEVYTDRPLKVPGKFTKRGWNSRVVVDLIVTKDNLVIALIETCVLPPEINSRKYEKYQALGVPFFFCARIDQLGQIIRQFDR